MYIIKSVYFQLKVQADLNLYNTLILNYSQI